MTKKDSAVPVFAKGGEPERVGRMNREAMTAHPNRWSLTRRRSIDFGRWRTALSPC